FENNTMKNVNLLLCLLLSAFFFSCDPDDEIKPTPEDGFVPLENAEIWKPEQGPVIVLWKTQDADSLVLNLFHETGRINVLVDFKGVGKYKFPESVTGHYYRNVPGEDAMAYFSDPIEVEIT